MLLRKSAWKTVGNIGRFAQLCSATKTKEHPQTQTQAQAQESEKINSWQIHSYGDLSELQFTKSRPPIIKKPNEVIVEVAATSVNPIDVAMIGGYGSVMLNTLRQVESCSLATPLEFPLTLGRDFSGVVIRKGLSVRDDIQIGDQVWGVIPPHQQGCHAEQVVVSESYIARKPPNISMIEAGGFLYSAVTAWSALQLTGDMAIFPAKGTKVLVLGGSGGVGIAALQLLKSWGAITVCTCNTDAVPLLESLGIPNIIDYTKDDAFQSIAKEGKYDIILDCAGIGSDTTHKYSQYLKDYNLSKYITLKSPVLKNVDEYGIIGGMVKNLGELLTANIGLISKSSTVRWGFFYPSESAIQEITKKVKSDKITPYISKVFSFEDVPDAYEKVKSGHLRGKVVIDLASSGE